MACRADGASWGHCASRGANPLSWFWLRYITPCIAPSESFWKSFWTSFWRHLLNPFDTFCNTFCWFLVIGRLVLVVCMWVLLNPLEFTHALKDQKWTYIVVSGTRPQVKHLEGLSRCPCWRDLNSCCFSCAESDRCGPSPSGNLKVRVTGQPVKSECWQHTWQELWTMATIGYILFPSIILVD